MDKSIDKIILETKMNEDGSYYKIIIASEYTTVFYVNDYKQIEKFLMYTWPTGISNIYEIFNAIDDFEFENLEFLKRLAYNE